MQFRQGSIGSSWAEFEFPYGISIAGQPNLSAHNIFFSRLPYIKFIKVRASLRPATLTFRAGDRRSIPKDGSGWLIVPSAEALGIPRHRKGDVSGPNHRSPVKGSASSPRLPIQPQRDPILRGCRGICEPAERARLPEDWVWRAYLPNPYGLGWGLARLLTLPNP